MNVYNYIFYGLFLSFAGAASADTDLIVVANKALDVDSLSKVELTNLYMGRNKYVGDNIKVIPLDIEDEVVKSEFYFTLVERTLSEVNSYWARLLFSGRAKPPLSVANSDQVIELIRKNPSLIGYIKRGTLPDDLKVISYVD